MTTNWTSTLTNTLLFTRFDQAHGFPPTLLFTRYAFNQPNGSSDSYAEWIAADLDGPVRFSMREVGLTQYPSCFADTQQIREGNVVLTLLGDGTGPVANTNVDGAMWVNLTAPNPMPRLMYRDELPGIHGWSVGAQWLHEQDAGADFLLSLPSGPSTVLHSVADDPDGLPMDGQVWFDGKTAVFQVGNYSEDAILSFDGSATHDLIRFPHDQTRGVENIGTDGVDMVWSLGENRPPNQQVYPTRSIYTSPYTTAAAKLAPRRLRSEPSAEFGLEEAQFAVGCGYAGRLISGTDNVEIVRLSDGSGWTLQGTKAWDWVQVLGFTCDEAIVEVLAAPNAALAVARVKLSSLGMPSPPD